MVELGLKPVPSREFQNQGSRSRSLVVCRFHVDSLTLLVLVTTITTTFLFNWGTFDSLQDLQAALEAEAKGFTPNGPSRPQSVWIISNSL